MRPDDDPSSDELEGLAKAYSLLRYNVSLLPQGEAEALAAAQVTPDPSRKTAINSPYAIAILSNGDKVGFLRLPSLPEGKDIPSKELIKKISTSIKEKRKEVKLLVALSDWGWVGEREYLAQNPDIVPDFLFGSGSGSGVNGRILAEGRCAWIRPYDKGRTVNEVQVYAWPDRSKPMVWKEPDNLKCLSIGLGDQYEDDEEISAILH